MIRVYVENCKWGADENEDGDGLQFNFLDEESNTMFHIPFGEESLDSLIEIVEKHKALKTAQ
jgi:hypothetical protein